MILSACFFGLMAITIRYASRQQHAFEIAFCRCFFGALAALPLIARHGWPILRTDKIGFYVARCVIGIIGMMAGFWAIVHLPLAQAIALSYSSPLFVTIGAVLFLGEIVRLRRWSAVAAGFIGALVIVRPGTDSMTAGAMIAVMAAALSGMTTVSIKFLSRSEPPDRIVLRNYKGDIYEYPEVAAEPAPAAEMSNSRLPTFLDPILDHEEITSRSWRTGRRD